MPTPLLFIASRYRNRPLQGINQVCSLCSPRRLQSVHSTPPSIPTRATYDLVPRSAVSVSPRAPSALSRSLPPSPLTHSCPAALPRVCVQFPRPSPTAAPQSAGPPAARQTLSSCACRATDCRFSPSAWRAANGAGVRQSLRSGARRVTERRRPPVRGNRSGGGRVRSVGRPGVSSRPDSDAPERCKAGPGRPGPVPAR